MRNCLLDLRGLILGLAVLTAACGSEPTAPSAAAANGPNIDIASVEVTPSDLNEAVGGTSQFTATIRDDQGRVVTDQPIVWRTSDTSVAQISLAGVQHAIGIGTATITATVGKRS